MGRAQCLNRRTERDLNPTTSLPQIQPVALAKPHYLKHSDNDACLLLSLGWAKLGLEMHVLQTRVYLAAGGRFLLTFGRMFCAIV